MRCLRPQGAPSLTSSSLQSNLDIDSALERHLQRQVQCSHVPRSVGSRLPLRATVVGRQVHFQMECPISFYCMPEREGCDDDNEAITRAHDRLIVDSPGLYVCLWRKGRRGRAYLIL